MGIERPANTKKFQLVPFIGSRELPAQDLATTDAIKAAITGNNPDFVIENTLTGSSSWI